MNPIAIKNLIQQRIDEVFEELQEKNEILTYENSNILDADKYQEIDFEATRLDGRLEELQWIKKLFS